MDFSEFIDKISQYIQNEKFSLSRLYFSYHSYTNSYHVIVHSSAFQSFLAILNENTIISNCSEYTGRDHVHFLVLSNDQLKPVRGVQLKPIKSYEQMKFVQDYTIEDGTHRHDFYCNITFSILSLEILSMDKILSSMSYVSNTNQLNISKYIKSKFFERSKSNFYLPEWDGKIVKRNLRLKKIDHAYKKIFVVRYQNTKIIFGRPEYIVYLYFISDNKSVLMCRECMKSESQDGNYERLYRLEYFNNSPFSNYFVKDPWNWCHACKQVPLFQTLLKDEIYEQYRYKVLGKSFVMFNMKTDYFKDGTIVKSQFHQQKRVW